MENTPAAKGNTNAAKSLLLVLFLLVNLILWVFFGYYILVNTVFKHHALAAVQSVKIGTTSDIVFASSPEIRPSKQYLNISINGVNRQIAADVVGLKLDNSAAYDYGKGSDIFAVWSAALSNLQSPVTITPEAKIDPESLLGQFGIVLTNDPTQAAYWQGDILRGCEVDKYYAQVDETAFNSEFNANIGKENIQLDLAKFLLADRPDKQFSICNKYVSEIQERISTLNKGIGIELVSNTDLALDIDQKWLLVDSEQIESELMTISANTKVAAQMGEYKQKDGSIWLLSPIIKGSQLNSKQTITNIHSWLNDSIQVIEPVYDDLSPELLKDKQVYDFTNIVAYGKTRIDIIRNGRNNASLVYAQYGIEAMDDVVVPAKARFSYIETIKPQPRGGMANGNPIRGGICNATTTIYRAALESGFQITERTGHGFYVPSYEWGYPMNIVDAAYYTSPKLDLAFINDYDFPILIDADIERPGDGWQYHTVAIRTSQQAPKRSVELVDWKKYNVYSATRFTGEFTRVVKDTAGSVIRQDKFISRYYR